MAGQLLSGIEGSKQVLENLKNSLQDIRSNKPAFTPTLAIVQVGDRSDSNVYINAKIRKAREVGMEGVLIKLPRSTTKDALENEIKKLNENDDIDGIIIQLPLDCEIDFDVDSVIDCIHPLKDVDGLTRFNAGRLMRGEKSAIMPCTPWGCLFLIKKALGNESLSGKNVTVVGRSKIVGAPAASMLIWENCTVTVCHSRTVNLKEHCLKADILFVAIGKKQFIKGDFVKPGAIVIDCGINVEPNPDSSKKNKIFGDVDTEEALKVASHVTPVPGGVGPMTVAMLLENTFKQGLIRRYNICQ